MREFKYFTKSKLLCHMQVNNKLLIQSSPSSLYRWEFLNCLLNK